jgi:hypothetical protein
MVRVMSPIDERCMAISLKDMIAELRRELRYRQITYPGLIKRGALTEAAADRQSARLNAALGVLANLEKSTLLQRREYAQRCPTGRSPRAGGLRFDQI